MLKLFLEERKRHIFWDSATLATLEPEGTVTTWIPWIDNKLTWSQKEAFEKLWTPNYRLANTYISFLCETESNSGLGLGHNKRRVASLGFYEFSVPKESRSRSYRLILTVWLFVSIQNVPVHAEHIYLLMYRLAI